LVITLLLGRYKVDTTLNLSQFPNTFLRETAPKLANVAIKLSQKDSRIDVEIIDEPIKIKGILVDEVTQPLDDGTKGSALYRIPFELTQYPSHEWSEMFVESWDRPSKFSSMHRPGIASVNGNKIILDGTTVEEVEQYHKETLKLAIATANKNYSETKLIERQRVEEENKRKEEHRKNVEAIGRKISFD
jgi:hypothetical protein